jgi:hypothetical protein
MSCTASATWNRLVLSLCCTEPGTSRGPVLSGRITTVAMSRSGQLGLCCTVEPNYSGMFARLAGASVTRNRALDTYEPSCVPGAGRPSLFVWSTSHWGSWGTWQHRNSPLGEARPGPRGSVGAHLGREARFGAEEHVTSLEHSSREGRAQSHGTRDSAGAHLGRKARSGAEEHVAAPEFNSARR